MFFYQVEEFVGHFKKQNTQPCGLSIGFYLFLIPMNPKWVKKWKINKIHQFLHHLTSSTTSITANQAHLGFCLALLALTSVMPKP